MTPSEDELLDVDEAIERLQAALRLQFRAALGYTFGALPTTEIAPPA